MFGAANFTVLDDVAKLSTEVSDIYRKVTSSRPGGTGISALHSLGWLGNLCAVARSRFAAGHGRVDFAPVAAIGIISRGG